MSCPVPLKYQRGQGPGSSHQWGTQDRRAKGGGGEDRGVAEGGTDREGGGAEGEYIFHCNQDIHYSSSAGILVQDGWSPPPPPLPLHLPRSPLAKGTVSGDFVRKSISAGPLIFVITFFAICFEIH